MNWLQTLFSSLLGTAVGASATGLIAMYHESKRRKTSIIEGLASVRTELLIAANRITSSIASAQMAMMTGRLPPINDDLTLMYRTHASILHANLSANDLLTITVAYSTIGTYAQGRSLQGSKNQFATTYGLYINALNAVYNAYMIIGTILVSRYAFFIPDEFPIFYLGANIVSRSCVFHMKSATDSTANRPPVPPQTGRPFHGNPAT